MPDMDGYEVCRRLRPSPTTASLPIIIFTAKTTVDDKVAGFQAGADDYLTKPIHPDELASRVEAVLSRSARRKQEQRTTIRAKVLGFLGSKGGVGTTTLAVNVAIALAQGAAKDKQVLLADMYSGVATTAIQLGLRHTGEIAQLLSQPAERLEAKAIEAHLDEHRSGVRVLSGQIEPPGVAAQISPAHADRILQYLGSMSDYLLLDLGIGLNTTNRHVLLHCDHVIVTVEPHRVALTLAQALLDEITETVQIPRHKIGVVLIHKSRSAATFTKETIEGLLQHELAGTITPAPELAFQAAEEGIPMGMMQPNSLVAQQFRSIADYLASV